ncbi:MAG: hypothetical protein L3K13_04520 [Thermoplasmata archaeon]|nr:hypothetical protein [Thermoplasmata archaeon]
MAKKGRQKIEERESAAFEFPVFDESAFIRHELELSWATIIGLLVALLLGVASAAVIGVGLPIAIPILVGLVGLLGTPFLIQRLRSGATTYTKGDWAGVIAVEIFVWLAVWFLLSGAL